MLALDKKCPLLSHAKANQILLGAPSMALPEDFPGRLDITRKIIRQGKDTTLREAEDLLFGVDLFFAALQIAWPSSDVNFEDIKQHVITLYKNNGWIE